MLIANTFHQERWKDHEVALGIGVCRTTVYILTLIAHNCLHRCFNKMMVQENNAEHADFVSFKNMSKTAFAQTTAFVITDVDSIAFGRLGCSNGKASVVMHAIKIAQNRPQQLFERKAGKWPQKAIEYSLWSHMPYAAKHLYLHMETCVVCSWWKCDFWFRNICQFDQVCTEVASSSGNNGGTSGGGWDLK